VATHGPIFSEKSNSIPSPEDAELYRRNAEYVDVHFPGVVVHGNDLLGPIVRLGEWERLASRISV
jgi:hypothetical protein